ncbi:MAG TPA: serine hydrolase, partial [Chloroflexota bacterium]
YRLGTHGLAVAIVGVALATASLSRPAAAVQTSLGPESDVSVAAPIGLDQSGGLAPGPTLAIAATGDGAVRQTAEAVPRTQGADQNAATVRFDPRLGLPQWLRAVRDAPLFSAADNPTPTGVSLPADTSYLKPLGPFSDTRVEVYFPGDVDHPAAQAWVDTAVVAPSGVPTWIAPPPPGQSVADGPPLPAPPQRISDADAPGTTAIHIAIVDDASGQMIYGEQPYTEVPQASTTKIATTIVALERVPDLTQRFMVTVSASAMVARDGSSTMGIEPGRSVSLDTLLHGMMLPSGNDAAEQVAISLAGSRDQYVDWMNQEAAALGLRHTHFVNPSGMDAAGHYSSAYDMAMLARYAMRNPTFRDLAGTASYTSDGFHMQNLNRLLGVYPGADGVKIGYTDAAHKTFVASAVHDGHRVYVSLMHSEDLVWDSTALFNWVWDTFNWQ